MRNLLLFSLALLPRLALAEEPTPATAPAPAEATAPADPDQIVLDLAEQLQQAGETRAAADVLDWLQDQEVSTPVALSAGAMEASLPRRGGRSDALSVIRFAAWEPATFTVLLGPTLAAEETLGEREGVYFGTALVGLGAGVGSTVFMALGPGLTPARVDSVLTAQQLGAFHGAVLGDRLDEHEGPGLMNGLALGGLLGTGAGYGLAFLDPHPATTAAARSGMFWGAGLTAAGLSYAYAWEDLEEDAALVMLAGADLGTAAGFCVGHFLRPSREQILMANVGGLTGAAAAYVFAWTTSEVIWYAPHTVVAVVGVSSLAGATLGVVLATRMSHLPAAEELPVGTALFSGTPDHLRLALPVPTATATPQGPALGIQLADVRF